MGKKKSSDIGSIKVIKVIEKPDGSATVTFETDDIFDSWAMERLGVKKLTKKMLGDFVLDILTKAANKLDGYDIAEGVVAEQKKTKATKSHAKKNSK